VGRHRADERTDAFRLLFVCTGNICRSPFAGAMLTRHVLRGRVGRVSQVMAPPLQLGEERRRTVMQDGRMGRHRRSEAEDEFRLLSVCTGNPAELPPHPVARAHALVELAR
jgi:Low molecular weight phosphotyrosine protein phosphatase